MKNRPSLGIIAAGIAALLLAGCGGQAKSQRVPPGLNFSAVKSLYSAPKESGVEYDLYIIKRTAKYQIAAVSMNWTKAAMAAGIEAQGCTDNYFVQGGRWFQMQKKLDYCSEVSRKNWTTKRMNNIMDAVFSSSAGWPSKFQVLVADPTRTFPTTTTTLSAYEIAQQSASNFAQAWNGSDQGRAWSNFPTRVTIQVSVVDGTFFTLTLGNRLQQFSNYVASSDTWFNLGIGNGYNSCPGQVPLNICEGSWYTFTFSTDGHGNIA